MEINKLINYRALSRHLSGGNTNIKSNHIPKKYRIKVNMLKYFVRMWVKMIDEEII